MHAHVARRPKEAKDPTHTTAKSTHLGNVDMVLLKAPFAHDLLILNISMEQLGAVPWTQHIHLSFAIGQ